MLITAYMTKVSATNFIVEFLSVILSISPKVL